ncbi:acetylglutamate kinase [Aliiglaciecola sp. M165]|uniref:acetylglutamate kinase n=1 Tax=Aliiglaciecola sp. M165 TaxID=2593649 RepID=UPI00117D1BE0|nr:acetylglutamate kinase [Aliiglaciecola sp. M165]TRY31373.1 acetylglutamate kinase [Aliiglaciecola sp. M165]
MTVKVVKVGGAFLDDPDISIPFFKALCASHTQTPIVLVHGGGSSVEKLMSDLDLPTAKIDGLRVTPPEQINYVVGALAGTVNKQLCALAQQAGLNTVGLSLFDGNMTVCQKINDELGNVGQATVHDPLLLTTLLGSGYLPIISSIGKDTSGQLLNVNADQAATVIAKLLNAQLVLLSDVKGVLDEHSELVSSLDEIQIDKLIDCGVIRDGMTVKVNAALDAAKAIQQPVTIASWKDLTIFNDDGAGSVGTTILPNKQEA